MLVADHKYMGPEEAEATLNRALAALQKAGLQEDRASKVKLIIENMSFSKEIDAKNQGAILASTLTPTSLLQLSLS